MSTSTAPRQAEVSGRDTSSRFFARVWRAMEGSVDEVLADVKDSIITDIPDRVVEIGPGFGSNFSRYPQGTTVVAFEPNAHMHKGLIESAETHGINLELSRETAEALPLPDASQDLVVSTLVLCSVEDPDRTLSEIQRVLKPGGRLVFVEHVAAPPRSRRRLVQNVIRRPWRALGDGCDLTRETEAAIRNTGFAEVTSETGVVGPKLDPSALTLSGLAVK